MKTPVPFMKRTITKKQALLRLKLQPALVIWTKMWPTRTPKDLEKRIIRNFIQQELKWRFHLTESCRESVNEKACGVKCITPKLERDGGMGKQSKTSLNYMTMLTLIYTILLMCMRTRHTMRNPKFVKKGVEVVVFHLPSQIEHG